MVDLDTRLFRPAAVTAVDARAVLPRGPQKRLRAALVRNEERLAELELRMQKDTKMGVRVQEKYKSHLVGCATLPSPFPFPFLHKGFLIRLTTFGDPKAVGVDYGQAS